MLAHTRAPGMIWDLAWENLAENLMENQYLTWGLFSLSLSAMLSALSASLCLPTLPHQIQMREL